MELKLFDLLRISRPLSRDEKRKISEIETCLDKEDLAFLKKLVKLKKAGFSYVSLNVSPDILKNADYPQIYLDLHEREDKNIREFTAKINKRIEKKVKEEWFKRFSIKADKIVPKLIAPNIIGMEMIKEAAALQLFSEEKVHVLLLGDPGTGKTEDRKSVV